MKDVLWAATVVGGLLLLSGCADEPQTPAPAKTALATDSPATAPDSGGRPRTAKAKIEGRSGSSMSGTAEFSIHDGQVMIVVQVQGAPPADHAVHIHETGDCSAPDAASAGGHFNPGGHEHGSPDADVHHAGDLGNMTVGADGSGTLLIHSRELALDDGPNAVTGRALIVHEKVDDFVTQPTGGAGGRIGCGVIVGGA